MDEQLVRVLVVDDSAFIRRAVERMLDGIPEIEVVGSAENGAEAVAKVKELSPDVVVLDVNMPRLDGLEALERIMAEAPTGVLMLSTLTREGAQTTVRALELGAVDFLDKAAAGTTMDIYRLAPLLREKILAVAGASVPRPPQPEPETAPPRPALPPQKCDYDVVVIGASTGGPRALAEIVAGLPGLFPAGIVVAQHMPAGFTETLANRLDRRSELEVHEAHDLATVEPGKVLLAPGGKQITLERRGRDLVVRVDDCEAGQLHRPSVDLLFGSAAEIAGPRAIGVVLTGMGNDGAVGLEKLREAGARTLAESADSAVIYGMPRAAAGSAERILSLRDITPALIELTAKRNQAEEGG